MGSKTKTSPRFSTGIRGLVGAGVLTLLLIAMAIGAGVLQGPKRPAEPLNLSDRPPDERADVAVNRGDWMMAATAMNELLDADPFDSRSIFYYAYALRKQTQLEQSIVWFEKAAEFFKYRPASHFQLACVHAQLGDTKAGIENLEMALQLGFKTRRGIGDTQDLQPLKSEAKFKSLIIKEQVSRKNYRR